MRAVAALALVATVALVGPVGPSPAGAASAPRPCKLLKTSEITAALDQPAGPGTDELVPDVCQWPLLATSARVGGTVNAFVGRGKGARRDYALGAEFNRGELEPIAGIGRKAFYAPSTGALWVLEDKSTLYYVQANVSGADGTRVTAGMKDALVRLATLAEDRL